MKKILVMAAAVMMAVAAIAAQCAGITKKGTQCKRQASPGSEYCWQHGGTTKAQREAGVSNGAAVADGRCQATTKSGERCKRNVNPGSKFCWQHGAADNGENAAEAARPAAPVKVPAKVTPKDSAEVGGQCTGLTKKGTRCTRKAQPGSDKCWQHAQ